MRVLLKKQADGKTWRKHFYGEFIVNGKRHVVNTNVRWKGCPPASMRNQGDVKFELSRTRAVTKLQETVTEAKQKGRADHLLERLIHSKTGQEVEHVKLADLYDKWMQSGEYSEGYVAQCKAIFNAFVKFIKTESPKAQYAYQVSPALASAFMDDIRSKMSRSTTNAYIGILRPAFDLCLPTGAQNPFRANKRRKKATAADAKEGKGFHRKPFTAEELEAVLNASRSDPMMYDLITVCACTGMRRGDVCKLRWEDINLAEGVVIAKASKTGETVEVPIFKPLRDVLKSRKSNGSSYVFPEAAEMLANNSDGLTWRFKKIIVEALSLKSEKEQEMVSASDIRDEAITMIKKKIPAGVRRTRMLDTFNRYCDGASLNDIVKATGRTKSTTSADLNAIEKITGYHFVRRQTKNVRKEIARLTQAHRERGQKAASIRDWHALRTTFVTLALSAGVDVELVKRVTGHKTTAIVLEHYFRPDRKTFTHAFAQALPEVLTGKTAAKVSDEESGVIDSLIDLLQKMREGEATKADKAKFKSLAAKVA